MGDCGVKVKCIKNIEEIEEGIMFKKLKTEELHLTIGKIYDVSIAVFDNMYKHFVVYDDNNEWERYSPKYFEGNVE